jgi:hypothetical protein
MFLQPILMICETSSVGQRRSGSAPICAEDAVFSEVAEKGFRRPVAALTGRITPCLIRSEICRGATLSEPPPWNPTRAIRFSPARVRISWRMV